MQQSTLTAQEKKQNTDLVELIGDQEEQQTGSDEINESTTNQTSLLLSPQKSSLITSSLIKDAVSTALSQFDLKEVLVPKKPNQSDVEKKAAISKHIKRPMNAFMVWAQAARRALSKTHPTLHNAQLSKTLGNMWHQLKEDQKLPFIEEANRLRDEHKNENPGYKYQPKRRPKMAFLSQTIASTINQASNQNNIDSKSDIKINDINQSSRNSSSINNGNNQIIIDSKFKHKYRKVLNKMEHSQKSIHGNDDNNENTNHATATKNEIIREKDEYPMIKKIKFNPHSQSLNKMNKQPPPPQPHSSLSSNNNHNHYNAYFNTNNNNLNNNHYHHIQNSSQQSESINKLSMSQAQLLQSQYGNTTLNSTNNLSNDDTSDTSGNGGGGAGFKILSEFKLNNTSLLHHSHSHLHHSQVLTPPLSSASSSGTTTANSSFQFTNDHIIYPNFTSSTSSSPTSNPYTQTPVSHLFQYQYANNGSYLSNNSSSSSSLSSQTNAYNQINHSVKRFKNKNGHAIAMNIQAQQRNRNNGDQSDIENEENDEDDDDDEEEDYNLSIGIKNNPIMSQVNNQTLEDISEKDLDENDTYNDNIPTNNENDLNSQHIDELDNISNVNDSNLGLNVGLNTGVNSTSPSSQIQHQQTQQHEPLASLTQFYINSRFNNPYVPSGTVSNQGLNSYSNPHMFNNSSPGFIEQGNSHYDRHHSSYSPYQNQLGYGTSNNTGNTNNLQQSAFDAYQQMPLQSTVEAHMAFSAYKQTHQYLHQIEAQQQAYSSPNANFIYQLQQAVTSTNDSSINTRSDNGAKRSLSNSPSLLINQTFDQSINKIDPFTPHSHHSNSSHSNSPLNKQFRLIDNIENGEDKQSVNNNLTSTQSSKVDGSNSPSSFSNPSLTSPNYTDNNQIKHSSFVPFTNNYV